VFQLPKILRNPSSSIVLLSNPESKPGGFSVQNLQKRKRAKMLSGEKVFLAIGR